MITKQMVNKYLDVNEAWVGGKAPKKLLGLKKKKTKRKK